MASGCGGAKLAVAARSNGPFGTGGGLPLAFEKHDGQRPCVEFAGNSTPQLPHILSVSICSVAPNRFYAMGVEELFDIRCGRRRGTGFALFGFK